MGSRPVTSRPGTHGAQEGIATIRTDGAPIPDWLPSESGVGTLGRGRSDNTGVLTPPVAKGRRAC